MIYKGVIYRSRVGNPGSSVETVKLKICLVGEARVGKSSLARRFVYNEFDERYLPTLGTNVSRKDIAVDTPKGPVQVVLTVWDIMGEPTFRDLLKDAYFAEVQGALAVADLTRPETVEALPDWISAVESVSGKVPVVILGNKSDLPAAPGAREALEALARSNVVEHHVTSAKSGDGVNKAFATLAVVAVLSAKRGLDSL